MDKLSDMYTSISPMAFGFNNPLQFMDPTGLSGDCDGCPEFTMPIFTVSSLGHRNNMVQLEAFYHAMRQSHNPVYRNLGLTAYRTGLRAARDLSQRGRKLHFSASEAQASRNSRYLDGIGKMVSYGITGSMVAAAASPMLVRGLVDGIGAKAVQNMGSEALIQISSSFVFNGDLSGVDLADIGLAGLFGKSAFFGQALVDFEVLDGFKTTIGSENKKTLWETSIDLGIGGFNSGYKRLLNSSEIDRKVIEIISVFNGGVRTMVGEAATPK